MYGCPTGQKFYRTPLSFTKILWCNCIFGDSVKNYETGALSYSAVFEILIARLSRIEGVRSFHPKFVSATFISHHIVIIQKRLALINQLPPTKTLMTTV